MSVKEEQVYRTYSHYLKNKYGRKVYKMPLTMVYTCPNRDGTKGHGGCAFCGEEGGAFGGLEESVSIDDQIKQMKVRMEDHYGEVAFMAYYQRFTSTYLPLEELKEYMEKTKEYNFLGVILGTRPDCLPDGHLDYLEALNEDMDVVLELGLQSPNNETLRKINRGHSVEEWEEAVDRCHDRGLRVCTHLILNFPWDDSDVAEKSAKILNKHRVEEVKLHALYIMEDTALGRWYQAGEFEMWDKEEYVRRVISFLRHLHPETIVQRVIGRAPEEGSLFVNWNTSWWKIRDQIVDTMLENGWEQGDLYEEIV